MRKHIFLLLFVVALFGGCTSGATKTEIGIRGTDTVAVRAEPVQAPADLSADEPDTIMGPVESRVAAIRSEYARVRDLLEAGKLRKEETRITCTRTDGDGYLVRYFHGDTVVFLQYETGVGHSFVTKSIYFKGDEIYFVYVNDGTWSPGGPIVDDVAGTISVVTETRYYIDSGRIIRQLNKTYRHRSWTNDPTSGQVPNKIVPVTGNTEYPDRALDTALRQGKVDC